MAETKERIEWVDLGAGIMLTWVMVFHALECKLDISPRIVFPYLSFAMPWFFYKSGMFFKIRDSQELLWKDLKKMAPPYFVWIVIGYLVYLISLLINDNFSARTVLFSPARALFLTGATYGNSPMWFLLTLFLSRQFANWLLKKLPAPLVILIGYLVAASVYLLNFRLMPFWIANTGSGMAFFAAGYWLNKRQNTKWLILLCLSVYALSIINGFIIVDQRKNTLIQGFYYLWIPAAICYIVTFNTVCMWGAKVARCIPCRFRVFSYISRNAIAFFSAHMVLLTIVADILCVKIAPLQSNCFLTIILGYISILPLISVIWANYFQTQK